MRKISFDKIFLIIDLLNIEELSFVYDSLIDQDWQDDEFSSNKIMDLYRFASLELGNLLSEKMDILRNFIQEDFNFSVGKEEIGTIVNYRKGWNLHLHADQWSNLPTYAGYPTRDISSIIYLTENFHGGNIEFPDKKLTIEPKAGSAIYFPSTEDYMHLVTEVQSGDRWACTSFWCNLNKSLNRE
jgi:hypothetical protein